MKGKSWSSNVGGWMVVSIWNCQCCKMLIGPPAGNELNRVGSGYFRWILAAAWKQPARLAGGFSSGSCSLNAPGLLQGYMYAVMPFGLSESHMDRQWQSSELNFYGVNHATPISPQAKRYLAAESQSKGNPVILHLWTKGHILLSPLVSPCLGSAKSTASTVLILHRHF